MARAELIEPFVALLRGVNVGGKHKLPMAQLTRLATALGWRDAATYLQSGNLVFLATGPEAQLAQRLEQAVTSEFGFAVPTVVVAGRHWMQWLNRAPFAVADDAQAKRVHLGVSKLPPDPGAGQGLASYCRVGEQVQMVGNAIWIDFVGGVAKSKLTSAVLDRMVGSVVTLRNWHTITAIAELLRAR